MTRAGAALVRTITSYRPISILSALSKIFEKCVLNQITFYFILEGLFNN